MAINPEVEKALRNALFVPCETKEELHRWIKIYLGADIPNVIVCDDDVKNPPSNSSPMDLIWDIYVKCRGEKRFDEDGTFWLAFAARDSFKTYSSALIEMLCLCHLNRSVGHLAAEEQQAKKCQEYIEKFFKRPILNEFLTSKNKRTIELTKYIHSDTGEVISPVQYSYLSPGERINYNSESFYMQIVIATVGGANGLHVPFCCFDELDLADPMAIEEAKMIPSPVPGTGELPVTFMTSTRKYSFGLVQKEIDNANNSGLVIKHWNIIDVTQACPPTRHLPEEPKIPIYYSEHYLKAISEQDYLTLSEKEKESYEVKEGYSGCLKNCKLFAQCKGRLVDKQTSKSKFLKPIPHVQALFSKVSLDHARAQLLCWKPSSEGLIYPYFSKEVHMITPAQMAERATGEKYPDNFSKHDLINLFKSLGAQFYSGMDHGFTHHFSVVTAALYGHVMYIIDAISVAQLELQQKIELCKDRLMHFNSTIYPDSAYPSDNKSFKKHGFRLVDFKKDIKEGVEAVRIRLMPGGGRPPALFMLKGDFGCELLASAITQYHWKVNKDGSLSDELAPLKVTKEEDPTDDILDAMRYLCQNVKINKVGVMTSESPQVKEYEAKRLQENPNKNWMQREIEKLTGESAGSSDSPIIGKSGGVMFTI